MTDGPQAVRRLCTSALVQRACSPHCRAAPCTQTGARASGLELWRRKAESAAAGRYPQAGVFLHVVGRALVFARYQPLALALALLLLLLAAATLLRVASATGGAAGNPFAWGSDGSGSRGGGGGPAVPRGATPRASAPSESAPRAAPAALPAADSTANSDGAPGCITHALGCEAAPSIDAAGGRAAPESTSAADSSSDAVAAVPEPPAPAGPIAAPIENPGVVRGVARLLSRAGRDDAAADVAEVFSLLTGAAALPATLPGGRADLEHALEAFGLPPEAAPLAFVEEVFENSRYMPLQGWGSSYPGHLLPTDRRRWSRFDATACADTVRELVQLPRGWAWSGLWQKDMRGAERGCVDSEGWSYAVDFKVRAPARVCAVLRAPAPDSPQRHVTARSF